MFCLHPDSVFKRNYITFFLFGWGLVGMGGGVARGGDGDVGGWYKGEVCLCVGVGL